MTNTQQICPKCRLPVAQSTIKYCPNCGWYIANFATAEKNPPQESKSSFDKVVFLVAAGLVVLGLFKASMPVLGITMLMIVAAGRIFKLESSKNIFVILLGIFVLLPLISFVGLLLFCMLGKGW